MAVLVEGFGEDWVVTRRADGSVECHRFSSLPELRAVFRRLEAKQAQRSPTPAQENLSRVNGAAEKRLPSKKKLPTAEFDCMTCGACCAHEDPNSNVYVRLSEDDFAGLPERVQRKHTEAAQKGIFLKTRKVDDKAVCRLLAGRIGQKCSCSIYDDRPAACRLFEVGSSQCLAARARVGLPTLERAV